MERLLMSEPVSHESGVKPIAARLPYDRPQLVRWGKLTDLTYGGGGRRSEPSKRQTRF
jgi:hypothetical protein